MKEEKDVNSKIISRITDKEDCIMILQLIGISGLKLDSKKLPDDSPVTVDTTSDNANEEMDENDTTSNNNESPKVFNLDIVAVLVFGKSGYGDT